MGKITNCQMKNTCTFIFTDFDISYFHSSPHYLCPVFDLVLSFDSPAVQPVDNQSLGSKMSLGLIYKQPRVNSIRSSTLSHLHLYHTSRIYTSPGLISCHSSEITLLPAGLLPVGEKAAVENHSLIFFSVFQVTP